jgi:hypothetical protein
MSLCALHEVPRYVRYEVAQGQQHAMRQSMLASLLKIGLCFCHISLQSQGTSEPSARLNLHASYDKITWV